MKLVGAVIAVMVWGCGSKDKPADPAPSEPAKTAPAKAEPASADLPKLADNAPKDSPKTLDAAREAKIAELTAQARKTYPDAKARFLKGLPPGENLFVVTDLTEGAARESAFLAVKRIQDGKITGAFATQFERIRGHKTGEVYTMSEADLVDWLISKPDGSEEGNLVGKYLDSVP